MCQKGKKLRICADYKSTLNKYLNEDKYPIPHIDVILAKLNGGRYFCKLDISRAYLHIIVDEETAKLQTITTHLGNFKVKRLFFGIKNAPSIWQRYIDQLIGHLPGVSVFFDDIKIQGTTQDELLQCTEEILCILKDHGLKLNRDKCEFGVSSLQYLGFRLDRFGIHKTDDKIKTIVNAPAPTNIAELRSLLGLINYYGRFIPNLSTILAPMTKRLHAEKKFKWTNCCKIAFQKVKEIISQDTTLIPFNPKLTIALATDASPVGVGAVYYFTSCQTVQRDPLPLLPEHYQQLNRNTLKSTAKLLP